MKHFGKTVREIIKEKNIKRNVLADELGLTPNYISIVCQKESVDCIMLERFCRVLGVNPASFFDSFEDYPIYENCAPGVGNAANANITVGEYEALKQLLEEKERTIKILMEARNTPSD